MRWIKSALSWLLDQFIEHLPTVLTVVVAGGGMSYLASITKWLEPYGPVSWGSIGIAAMLVVSFAYYLLGIARDRHAQATYVRAGISTHGVNVLAPIHQHERISLWTFFHPFYHPTENARFEDCEFFGPANLVLDGAQLFTGGFCECEIVIVRPDRPVKGAMLFKNCTFLDFQMYRVTLLMNITTYQGLPDVIRQNVPVISDGRVGDI